MFRQKKKAKSFLFAFKVSDANTYFFLATLFLGAAFLTTFLTTFLTAFLTATFFLTAMIKSPPFILLAKHFQLQFMSNTSIDYD